ncbi:acyltransferase family protein [Alcanivorax sp. IL3]|uniref:acyltransferase family protein n=1 Tax=unclassified Alcanivorax TaxID=2638842 RepID=UPI0039C40188
MTISYRPEVDGLRFIAVMLVILHHLGIPGFGGGFVGVDVFFVISGYLITCVILNEANGGSFSFGRFYQRRVIRLAPAYFLVLLVTSTVASIVMLPSELVHYAKSVVYSTFFAANFFMWDVVGGYFGTGAETTPLLHLWSLAVEEQFYLLWPLALLFFNKFITSRKFMLGAMLSAFVLMLFLSEYGALHYRAAAYYLMPTRAFELLLGAVLVFLPSARISLLPRLVSVGFSILGIGLIIYSAVAFSDDILFPGMNALIPCLGTALVILFSDSDTPVTSSLLTNRLSVAIGKVSYPAYLWHWPMITFLNIYLVDISFLVALLVVSLTFLLSILTYRLVELPAREYRKYKNSWVIAGGFLFPALLFSAFSFFVMTKNGFPSRFDDALNVKAEAVMTHADQVRGRCNEGPVMAPLSTEKCVLGNNDSEVSILLVGDSHANHFSGMVDVLAKDAGLRGYDVTRSNTVFLVGVDRYFTRGDEVVKHANFRSRNDYIENELLPRQYPYVVLGGNYVAHLRGIFGRDSVISHERGRDVFVSALSETVKKIISHGSIPVIIKGSPVFGHDISRCTLNNARFGNTESCEMPRQGFDMKSSDWNDILNDLMTTFDEIIVIDPSLVMCDEHFCYSELSGVPLYKDSGHLNYKGSELIGELYLDRLGNPFE